MASACGSCGSENPASSRFCGHCGKPLADGPTTAAAQAPDEAQRRLVSVLFADITGFTSFSESRDPEEVRALLTRYFDECREVIERFGGTVDKFIGDAVTAVWGAVTAHEDDAERAVRSGLELTDVVAKLGADIGADSVALRVGVLTGEASVGPGGNEMGLVVGDMVNTASRLQSAAEPGTVFVGESTFQAARHAVAFEAVGEQDMKGKAAPVAAWKALQVVAERGGRGRAETIEPPFVGRADELRLLKDMLASVGRDQRARLVSIVGEGGIGKSRLVWEFLKFVDGLVEDVYWHEGRSPSYGEGLTYWAVAEMIRSRAGIADGDDDAASLTALSETIERFVPEADERDWILPRVATVLGLADAPPGERSELDAALRGFFQAIAESGTVVLVFEDMHWADPALIEFVQELTEWSHDHPIMVVTLFRPDLLERHPTWGVGKSGFMSSHLGPLTEPEMTALVVGTVPGIPEQTAAAIVGRAEGMPLYAVEMIRMLVGDGEIDAAEGRYEFTGDVTDLAIPESLQAVIGARIDRLDADHRKLLQDAAILGISFTPAGLAALSGVSEAELEAALSDLSRRELLEPVRDPRSPERGQYRFVQGLIREVVVGRMSRDSRRQRHLDAATHFESLEDPEMALVIATHYLEAFEATPDGDEAARLRSRALGTLTASVDRVAALRAHEQVVTMCEQALELAADDAERAPFWERLTEAAGKLADPDSAVSFGLLALEHYRVVDNEVAINRMVRLLAFSYTELQRPSQAVELLADHLEGRDLASDSELARAGIVYARSLMLAGQFGDVVAQADRALAAAERLGLVADAVDGIITRATMIGSSGRRLEARVLLEGAVELARERDLPHASIRALNNLGYLFGSTDPDFAFDAIKEALQVARKIGDRSQYLFMTGQMFAWLIGRGELDQIDIARADPLSEGAPGSFQSVAASYGAQVALLRGQEDEAERLRLEGESHRAIVDVQGQIQLDATNAYFVADREGPVAGFNAAIDVVRSGKMTGALKAYGCAWSNALLSGDLMLVEEAAQLAEDDYSEPLEVWIRVLRQMPAVGEGDADAIAAALDAVALMEQASSPISAIEARAGIARFLAAEHPAREGVLDDALRGCEQLGAEGLRRRIEQYVIGADRATG